MDPEIPVLTGLQVLPAMVPTAPYSDSAFFEGPSTVTAATVVASPPSNPATLPEASRQVLAEQGFTQGLIEAMESNCKRAFAHSVWVVDNSGSMQTHDGQRIIINGDHHTCIFTKHHHPNGGKNSNGSNNNNNSNYKFVPSTRWAEMQQTVDYHAQLAALLEFPTTFRLLNDPGRVAGPPVFTVSSSYDLPTAQSTMEQTQPAGVTPLARHLRDIAAAVRAMEAESLRQNGQRVTLTLATDGIPTDELGQVNEQGQQEFMAAMRELEGLPIWIVVRLCTENEEIVRFWNELDRDLELSLEVLDDFVAEATEVHQHNPWLNYGLPLHRMREMGFYHAIFDSIDERPLHKSEVKELMKIIFGRQKVTKETPDPDSDWKGFAAKIASYNAAESKQYNPLHKKLLPWIDMHQLDKAYGPPKWFFGLF